ncbi:hypothetical protein EAI30_09040 [Romboutsia ilealis]|uniref:Membrane-associated protein n=1 Tax=Romboutsia faecis TaxID=2764597 RepID=A0ABR7JQA7_9FIRM|nr:hypothetical protein [Romboutsia faecis]MBC5996786.1 hypothetical protein [Romboutsia faecis]MRN24758.1 hypothetical protein [Romboutsia ilealis]
MNKKLIVLIIVFILAIIYIVNFKWKDEGKIIYKQEYVNKEILINNIYRFIPNESYSVVYEGTDLAPEIIAIEGDGEMYQTIGVNGKGLYRDVFKVVDNNLMLIYKEDLHDKNIDEALEQNLKDEISYNKNESELILQSPIEVGQKWDNTEIVEVGMDLKLDDILLEGIYIKTVSNTLVDNESITTEIYYSEGLGVVKYRVLINEEAISYYQLKSFKKN